ncbi:MAG: peroxidase family protein [Pseudomonadota bacterium]
MKTPFFLNISLISLSIFALTACGTEDESATTQSELSACIDMAKGGLRPIADDRSERFLGKVEEATALCRGGQRPLPFRETPWVDWSNYWATGDLSTQSDGAEARTILGEHLKPNGRGIDGSLMDLEYQRIELIKFNLFDNYTYETYVKGLGGIPGSSIKQWPEMRLDPTNPFYAAVGGDGEQLCTGELIRFRNLTGICNDITNPKMGSTGTLFSRNAQFEATFPDLGKNPLAIARHSDPENGNRLGLYKPDPQLISRSLFTRQQTSTTCNQGLGLPDYSAAAECDYQKAPFFNVLAAFWIQFMTHDWFSHTEEGRNTPGLVPVGCESEEAIALGCRPEDRMEATLYADSTDPDSFDDDGEQYQSRAFRTTENNISAWWDASQIYGHDDISVKRAIRDPDDQARLKQPNGYLPLLDECQPDCSVQPQWQGQEAAAFPDNWNIGLSFYHNIFVREHNSFVDRFRALQRDTPDRDSGFRNPASPDDIITYAEASDEEIFQAGRLVVSAMIAKIHTIEWTTQLLYDEPLYRGMNANWFGLFNSEENDVSVVLRSIFDQDQNILTRTSAKIASWVGRNEQGDKDNAWYSVLASGAGIFGLNNTRQEGFLWWKKDAWDITNPQDVNGGINHFGSPFNFPEEFTTVYRLHPLVPDLIEYREWQNPNDIALKIPVVRTARGEASGEMRNRGLENWALSMGRQRLGLLQLQNHPMFLQNLDMPHLGPGAKIDVPALDLIRDRERGVPRFNEFRRQIGLKALSGYDDFVDQRLAADSPARKQQEEVVGKIRAIYGTHVCDESKIITAVQRDANGNLLNDCLGHPNGTRVDNIEDVDMVVGWLSEYTRPHGYAISETQFHIFIINASRRLFSDRFFTSSFRPEFYSHLGYDWVLNNGPLDDCPYPLTTRPDDSQQCLEPDPVNGHVIAVSPMKRVMMRNIPELRDELMHVVNVFDPWARDRGEYYSLDWKPRADAQDDPAFSQ